NPTQTPTPTPPVTYSIPATATSITYHPSTRLFHYFSSKCISVLTSPSAAPIQLPPCPPSSTLAPLSEHSFLLLCPAELSLHALSPTPTHLLTLPLPSPPHSLSPDLTTLALANGASVTLRPGADLSKPLPLSAMVEARASAAVTETTRVFSPLRGMSAAAAGPALASARGAPSRPPAALGGLAEALERPDAPEALLAGFLGRAVTMSREDAVRWWREADPGGLTKSGRAARGAPDGPVQDPPRKRKAGAKAKAAPAAAAYPDLRSTACVSVASRVVLYSAGNPLLLRSAMKEALTAESAPVVLKVLGKVLRSFASAGLAGPAAADAKAGIAAAAAYIAAVVDTFATAIAPKVGDRLKRTVADVIKQGEALRAVGGEEKGWDNKERTGGYVLERLVL
ncbi:hypothetical protein TeGR_g4301, partial [Tetraparma gracilis]